MPSRRQLLSGMGAISASALAGCFGYRNLTNGVVWNKQIIVKTTGKDGSPVQASILNLTFDPGNAYVYGEYDPKYFETAIDGASVTISEDLHNFFLDEFIDFRYHVGIEPLHSTDSPVNAAAIRNDFNQIAIGGRATVGTYWGEGGYGYVHLHSTEPRNQQTSRVSIRTFDFDALVKSA